MSIPVYSSSDCSICHGEGYIGGELCECQLLKRVKVFMRHGGFTDALIDFVLKPEYTLPYLESGDRFISQVLENPARFVKNGLSLYIFSREAGRGKTCLATYLVTQIAKHFLNTKNYTSGFSLVFQPVNDLLDDNASFTSQQLWKSATVYVLDDVGNEDRSMKSHREAMVPTMQRILQYRRNARMPTIITSNYVPFDLGSLYSGRIDSLLEIGVDGVIEGELFRQIEVGGGEDLRTLTSAWGD